MRHLCALAVLLLTLSIGACSRMDQPAPTEVSQAVVVSEEGPVSESEAVLADEPGEQPTADPDEGEDADASSRLASTQDPNLEVIDQRSSDAALAKGEINFDDLKFDIEKDAPFEAEMITDGLRKLEGRNVKLRGYILPSTLFSETNISQFVLVRDNQECCFGPGAALFDCVMIQMEDGATTDFVTRPVTVEGKFEIDTESYRYPPGTSPTGASHLAIFRIEGKDVK